MPPRTAAELADLDRRVLWHPFTQQRGWSDEVAPVIERAEGCTLWDVDGNPYLDGVSSLWCNVHGHRHPHIDAAVRDQLDRVAHSTMLGLTHVPGIELASRLVDLAPDGLSRVFYSDNGSTANEIALKMAYQYHHQRGEWWRSGFICLKNGYHGDTIGSVVGRRHRAVPLALPPAAVRDLAGRARRHRRHGARCSASTRIASPP